jgi:hypothetical protein
MPPIGKLDKASYQFIRLIVESFPLAQRRGYSLIPRFFKSCVHVQIPSQYRIIRLRIIQLKVTMWISSIIFALNECQGSIWNICIPFKLAGFQKSLSEHYAYIRKNDTNSVNSQTWSYHLRLNKSLGY